MVRTACAATVIVAALVLLRRTLTGTDVPATLRAVTEAGRWAPLALATFPVTMALDAAGMGILLRALGRPVPIGRLWPIRMATEALHLTAPAGFVVADSATAALLDARCGVPLGEGAVVVIARKWLVMRAHAVYIVLGAVLGYGVFGAVSMRDLGGRWLAPAVAASAIVPLTLSIGVGAGFKGVPSLSRLQAAVVKLPWASMRVRVEKWRSGAAKIDGHLASVGSARAATWTAAAAFFAAWLLESVETCIIVRLVGGPLDLAYAMAAEVGISLLRSIGNVAPAGLGVQDAGYVVLLQAMGLPSHTTAAFVLLKRGKEMVWIAVGYILLGAMRTPTVARSGVGTVSARFMRRIA